MNIFEHENVHNQKENNNELLKTNFFLRVHNSGHLKCLTEVI